MHAPNDFSLLEESPMNLEKFWIVCNHAFNTQFTCNTFHFLFLSLFIWNIDNTGKYFPVMIIDFIPPFQVEKQHFEKRRQTVTIKRKKWHFVLWVQIDDERRIVNLILFCHIHPCIIWLKSLGDTNNWTNTSVAAFHCRGRGVNPVIIAFYRQWKLYYHW